MLWGLLKRKRTEAENCTQATKRPRARPSAASARTLIRKATAVSDIFGELQLPRNLSCGLGEIQLHAYTGATLCQRDCEWMVHSVKTELQHLYEQSLMEWNEAEKRAELQHGLQRLIIARHGEQRVGFISYRWEVEEGRAVMYVYELGVVEEMRGKGIGFGLMGFVEKLCKRANVPCIMLTVFNENRAAMRLYRDKLKYVVDESSPSRHGHEDAGYEILCKAISCDYDEDAYINTAT